MLSEKKYLYGLSLLPGLGPIRLQQLLEHFRFSPGLIWDMLLKKEFPKHSFFLESLSQKAYQVRLEEEWERLCDSNCRFVCLLDKDYPYPLKQLPDPPVFLFYRGTLPLFPAITVVGSRKMSGYGKSVLEMLLPPLCDTGIPVISGLAYGVDKEAHEIALAHGLLTTAVLGSGIEKIQPAQHELLAQRIIDEGGCIMSEFPFSLSAQKGMFPRRNRILAGLSQVTLVIEAAQKSGALITARYALEYNREVGAVPGSVFSEVSKGSNQLLAMGAVAVTSPDDLRKLLSLSGHSQPMRQVHLLEKEKNVLNMITSSPQNIDVLAQRFSGHSADLFATLSALELKKLIRHLPGEGYALVSGAN